MTEENEALRCLDYHPHRDPCEGAVEYRMPLSSTGRSFARCEKHFEKRLTIQEGINERYPALPPSDFDPADAGEQWEETY